MASTEANLEKITLISLLDLNFDIQWNLHLIVLEESYNFMRIKFADLRGK